MFPETAMNFAAWNRFLRDEDGQDLIEYALVAALIALAAIAAMKDFATQVSAAYSSISSEVTSAIEPRR
jgi:pilus assembly protein Flp/PilA